MRNSTTSKIRVLSLILLPLVFSALISINLIYSATSSRLTDQSIRFGQAVCDHLAQVVTDHLINGDLLGLNVLLTDLIDKKNFDSASVYNASNALLAQGGRRSASSRVFTQEVTFQNSIKGYVQIGFDKEVIQTQLNDIFLTLIGFHCLLLVFIAIIGWFYGNTIYGWIMLVPNNKPRSPDSEPVTEAVETATTILVFKLRPTRLLSEYKDRIEKALALYSGQLDFTDGEDIVICFNQTDQLQQAICSGLLVLEIFDQIDSPVTIKAGLHRVLDTEISGDLEQAKKHASYLASMTENQLLTSRLVQESITSPDQYRLEPFHSSMSPDGEVFSIDALASQDLIQGQAKFMVLQS